MGDDTIREEGPERQMVLSPTRQVWLVARAQGGDGGTHRVLTELRQLKPTAGEQARAMAGSVASPGSQFDQLHHQPQAICDS